MHEARARESRTPLNLAPIVRAILAEYPLPVEGYHGVTHWARVLENGLWLCERTGADADVVRLFAVFHDSRRINESYDPGHGRRGAEFAAALRGELYELSDSRFALLERACSGHTDERTHADITIATCWDADRLDLGRIGMTPEPDLLCTDVARQPESIRRAHGRASFRTVPDLVESEWGVVL